MAVEKAPTPADKAWTQSILAWAWSRGGEPLKAVEHLAGIVSMSREARFIGAELFQTPPLVEAYCLGAQYEAAQRASEEMLEIATRSGMRFHVALAHRIMGEIALSTGSSKMDEAASRFETSIGILRKIEAQNELALTYAGYGRLLRRLGRVDDARHYLTRALEIFERLGTLTEPERVQAEPSALPPT